MSGATILDQVAFIDNNGGDKLFNSFANPYPTSACITSNFAAPYVTFNAGRDIMVGSVNFYSTQSSGEDQFPNFFEVSSSMSATGPFIFQGTGNYSGAYPPTQRTGVSVLLDDRRSVARFLEN